MAGEGQQQAPALSAPPRRDRERRGDRDRDDRRFRRPRRKVCMFCADKLSTVDYKDVARLRRLVSDRGRIMKSRHTGTCAKHQRKVTIAVKRARHLALLPFVAG